MIFYYNIPNKDRVDNIARNCKFALQAVVAI